MMQHLITATKLPFHMTPALYIDKYRYVGKKYGQAYYYFIAASKANQYPVLLKYRPGQAERDICAMLITRLRWSL